MKQAHHQIILQTLCDGEFHSGEELASQMGISRTAVWKRLQHTIAELGIEIEAVRGKGYRLTRPLEILSREAIQQTLTQENLPQPPRLDIHTVTDSTNQRLLDDSITGTPAAPSGSICLAEYQTAGRGRRGRQWTSPFGSNIYLSMLHRTAKGPAALGGLSIAAGLTVARILRQAGGDEIGLEWPNDLLWRGRKLAGLLVEVAGEQAGPSRAVIGLGINLRLSKQQGDGIDQPWVDLEEILATTLPSRNLLAAQLIGGLLEMTRRFEQHGLSPWLDQWREFDLYQDQPVELIMGDRRHPGICRGINENGALLLEQQGQITTHHGGEVSLRGKPGSCLPDR